MPAVCQVDDSSRIGDVRRAAVRTALEEGASEEIQSNVAIVATELATNLFKHAQQGEIHIQALSPRGHRGVEILSIDRGPGIANLDQALRDGFSTTGTTGTGLGSVRRLSHCFDVLSESGKGTVVLSQIFSSASLPVPGEFILGLTAKPISGEEVSGDAWGMRRENGTILLVMADGLGHGVLANEAATEAVRTFQSGRELEPVVMVQEIHRALRGTRGAAVAVARIDFTERQVRFSGLGNIMAVVAGHLKAQVMVSHNGTAGHEAGRFKEFVYPLEPESLVILHSDGLSQHWSLDAHPGIRRRHPSVIAAVLYREAARLRDDVCVVVGGRL